MYYLSSEQSPPFLILILHLPLSPPRFSFLLHSWLLYFLHCQGITRPSPVLSLMKMILKAPCRDQRETSTRSSSPLPSRMSSWTGTCHSVYPLLALIHFIFPCKLRDTPKSYIRDWFNLKDSRQSTSDYIQKSSGIARARCGIMANYILKVRKMKSPQKTKHFSQEPILNLPA